jgi:membrane-associated phospholipid phosphatase
MLLVTPRSYLVNALIFAALAGTLAGIANTQTKRAVDRPRPIVYFEKHASQTEADIHIVGKPWRRHSFPSGHAATAFAAATILVALYGVGRFYLSFLPALLVAYSRVYMGVHFPFDTLAGALIGIGVVFLLASVFRRLKLLPRVVPRRSDHAEQP